MSNDRKLDGWSVEEYKSRVVEALDVADAVLWHRAQRGMWLSPQDARKALRAHKKIEEARDLINDVDLHPPPSPEAQKMPDGLVKDG